MRAPLTRDVVDAQQRRALVGQPEEALEADREVEVAARPEAALREGVEPREPALAQRQPGAGVGADHDVGLAAWARCGPCSGRPRARPPRCGPTSPSRTWYGGVEARLGAEVALGKRGECLLDPAQPVRRDESRHPCSRASLAARAGLLSGVASESSQTVAGSRGRGNSIARDARGPDPGHARAASCGRSSPARRGRDLRLRADRLQPHPHRQRAALRRLLAAARASCAREGYEVAAGHQRHRHQRQDLRRRARGRGALGRVRGAR